MRRIIGIVLVLAFLAGGFLVAIALWAKYDQDAKSAAYATRETAFGMCLDASLTDRAILELAKRSHSAWPVRWAEQQGALKRAGHPVCVSESTDTSSSAVCYQTDIPVRLYREPTLDFDVYYSRGGMPDFAKLSIQDCTVKLHDMGQFENSPHARYPDWSPFQRFIQLLEPNSARYRVDVLIINHTVEDILRPVKQQIAQQEQAALAEQMAHDTHVAEDYRVKP